MISIAMEEFTNLAEFVDRLRLLADRNETAMLLSGGAVLCVIAPPSSDVRVSEKPADTKPLLVVAGDRKQAHAWAGEWGVSRWEYVASARAVEGVSNRQFIRVGSWERHPEIAEILRTLRLAESFGVRELFRK